MLQLIPNPSIDIGYDIKQQIVNLNSHKLMKLIYDRKYCQVGVKINSNLIINCYLKRKNNRNHWEGYI